MEKPILEEVICGILLRDPDLFIKHPIESKWFSHCAAIIRGMQSLIGSGKHVDVFSLRDITGESLEELVRIQKSVIGAKGNYQLYLDKLKSAYKRSEAKKMLELALSTIDDGSSIDEALSGVINRSIDIHSDTKTQPSLAMADAVQSFITKFETSYDNRMSGKHGVKTHIAGLDRALGGLHGSDLIVVGARPGVGKTAIGASILYNVLRSGKRCGFFSIEMPTDQIMGRFVAIDSGISAKRIRDTELREDEWKEFGESVTRVGDMDMIISDQASISASEIVMQARAWHSQKPLDVLLIDYLTKIRIDNPTSNHHIDVGNNVQLIKNLAKALNIPILLLAQLNRNVAGRADKRPLITDLRDSGVIEQEADQILLLHRESMYDEQAPEDEGEILIEKNRHGPCGLVRCRFHAETIRWEGMQ